MSRSSIARRRPRSLHRMRPLSLLTCFGTPAATWSPSVTSTTDRVVDEQLDDDGDVLIQLAIWLADVSAEAAVPMPAFEDATCASSSSRTGAEACPRHAE